MVHRLLTARGLSGDLAPSRAISRHVQEQLTYCVVLEYCDGGDLHQALQRPTPPGFFLRVAGGVATGLAFLHGRGIMHRDLKSPNVLLHGERGVKIADFGLAALRGDCSGSSSRSSSVGGSGSRVSAIALTPRISQLSAG